MNWLQLAPMLLKKQHGQQQFSNQTRSDRWLYNALVQVAEQTLLQCDHYKQDCCFLGSRATISIWLHACILWIHVHTKAGANHEYGHSLTPLQPRCLLPSVASMLHAVGSALYVAVFHQPPHHIRDARSWIRQSAAAS